MKNFHGNVDALLSDAASQHEQYLTANAARFQAQQQSFEQAKKYADEVKEKIGIDKAGLDKINRQEAANLQNFLAETRPALLARDAAKKLHRDRALYFEMANKPATIVTTSIASIITATDNRHLAHIQGPAGNGWIFPADPSVAKIAIDDHGAGDGCHFGAQAVSSNFVAACFVFQFTPQSTGLWSLVPVVAFHGFYVLRANDTWLTCKSASVKLYASVSINQFTELGPVNFPLFEKEDDNIQDFNLYDATEFFNCTAMLRAGDEVTVTVQAVIQAEAHGEGSYAELNFAAGNGNFILPLMLAAQPVGL